MAAPLAIARAVRMARRYYPVAMAAYRRWQSLSPEEKERYKERARGYAERGQRIGRDAYTRAQQQRRGGRR
jgi:hypothetical protein